MSDSKELETRPNFKYHHTNVFSKLSLSIQKAVELVPDEYWSFSPEDMEENKNFNINTTVRMLRNRFWEVYDKSAATGDTFDANEIFKGICSTAHFYNRILKSSETVAYIFSQPTSYKDILKDINDAGLRKLQSAIKKAVIINEKTGKLDAVAVQAFTKLIEFSNVRLYGNPVQRVENKNLTLSGDIRDAFPQTPEQLHEQIKLLEEKRNEQKQQERALLDVTPAEAE